MADIRPRSSDVPRGLETTRNTNSSRLTYSEYLNSRTAKDSDKRRKGMVRLYRFAAGSVSIDFDGTNDYVPLTTSTRVFPLGTRFTLETLFSTDDIASNRTVLGRAAAGAAGVKIVHNTSSEVVTTITDSAAAATTVTHTGIAAGTVCAYQLTRDGASVVVKINGTSQTATISATNSLASGMVVGADNGADFYDGRIDFLRIFRVVKANQLDGWARLVNPRSPSVVVDYVYEIDSGSGYVLDRGPYGLHVSPSGSPATNVASIAVNPAPVLGIASNLDTTSTQRAYIRAAGAIYPVVLR